MKAENRQAEVNPNIVKQIGDQYGQVIHLKPRKKGGVLEGTGSLVFDNRLNKLYCSISERADRDTLK